MRSLLVFFVASLVLFFMLSAWCNTYSSRIYIYNVDPVGFSTTEDGFVISNITPSGSISLIYIDKSGGVINTTKLKSDLSRYGRCTGFCRYNSNYYYLVKSSEYKIITLSHDGVIISGATINATLDPDILLDSILYDGEKFWFSYHSTSVYKAGIIRLNKSLDSIEVKIELDSQRVMFAIINDTVWIVDDNYVVYKTDIPGNPKKVADIKCDIEDIADELNTSTYRLAGIGYDDKIWVGVVYYVGPVNESITVLLGYDPQDLLAFGKGKPFLETVLINPSTGIICGCVTLFSILYVSKALVVQPIVQKEMVVAESMGEGAPVTPEAPKPPSKLPETTPLTLEMVKKKEDLSKLKNLLGLRKLRHIPEKDRAEKPNFDKAMGYAVAIGLLIGGIMYIRSIIENIYTSIGINVGLLLSSSGILAGAILWRLKRGGTIILGRLSTFIIIICIPIAIFGIIINSWLLIGINWIFVVIEVIVALLLIIHRYLKFVYIRRIVERENL